MQRTWERNGDSVAEAQHTAGPWTVGGKNYLGDYVMCCLDGYSIATVATEPSDELLDGQPLANAHLIAAAPDMLAALFKIAQGGNHVRTDWPASPALDRESMCDIARAVIAKATGATP